MTSLLFVVPGRPGCSALRPPQDGIPEDYKEAVQALYSIPSLFVSNLFLLFNLFPLKFFTCKIIYVK